MSIFTQTYTVSFWFLVIFGMVLGILAPTVIDLKSRNKILKLEKEDAETARDSAVQVFERVDKLYVDTRKALKDTLREYSDLQTEHEELKKEFEETSKQLEYYKGIHKKTDKMSEQLDTLIKKVDNINWKKDGNIYYE